MAWRRRPKSHGIYKAIYSHWSYSLPLITLSYLPTLQQYQNTMSLPGQNTTGATGTTGGTGQQDALGMHHSPSPLYHPTRKAIQADLTLQTRVLIRCSTGPVTDRAMEPQRRSLTVSEVHSRRSVQVPPLGSLDRP